MAFEQAEIDSYQRRIPGAAAQAEPFLEAVLLAARSEGVPAPLELKRDRKGRTVLRARKIRFGGFMNKSRPMQLEVFADPMGRNLNVGWQLTALTANGWAAESGLNPTMEAAKDRKDRSPQVQREIAALIDSFQEGAFLPSMHRLLESVGASTDRTA